MLFIPACIAQAFLFAAKVIRPLAAIALFWHGLEPSSVLVGNITAKATAETVRYAVRFSGYLGSKVGQFFDGVINLVEGVEAAFLVGDNACCSIQTINDSVVHVLVSVCY